MFHGVAVDGSTAYVLGQGEVLEVDDEEDDEEDDGNDDSVTQRHQSLLAAMVASRELAAYTQLPKVLR